MCIGQARLRVDAMGALDRVIVGQGALGQIRYLNAKKIGNRYYLIDDTRSTKIITKDAKHGVDFSGFIYWDKDGKLVHDYDETAVDAHYYAGVVYDFWKQKYNRESYDGKGSPIVSLVHYGYNYNNAFWNENQMVYGDGDGRQYRSLSAALDVVAHELTHAVMQSEVGFIYEGESGAVEEAIADIFAVQVEKFHKGSTNWELGEDVYTPYIDNDAQRSLADPKKYGGIDHYSKRYKGADDNGGVHYNATIIGKAAHLLSEGGTHYGITVQGIGMDKMGQIYYHALVNYLQPNTNFQDLKRHCIQSAKDLFGNTSQEAISTEQSFEAVGIKKLSFGAQMWTYLFG